MSLLSQKLNDAKRMNQISNEVKVYTVEGARFQEQCVNMLPGKTHPAYNVIGKLVTAINHRQMTVAQAEREFQQALWANR